MSIRMVSKDDVKMLGIFNAVKSEIFTEFQIRFVVTSNMKIISWSAAHLKNQHNTHRLRI